MPQLVPTPINEAEAILIPFWNPARPCLPLCECWANPNAKAEFGQNWCWVFLRWSQPMPGLLGRMSVPLEVPLLDYDRLFVYVAIPKGVTLTAVARVDGREQTLLAAVPGNDLEDEYEGPISGQRLETLELRFEAVHPVAGEVTLCYVGLAATAARAQMAHHARRYTPDWPDHLLPAGHEAAPRPQLDLFFGADDLVALRRKAQSPLYAPLMEQMRRDAREALRVRDPEAFVGPYVLRSGEIGGDNFMRPSLRRWTPVVTARTCAFVGLLDGDVELLRFAARCALAMAHCDTWVGGPMENFTGSRWHQRSFLEATYAYSVLQVWDWAGSVLTDEGRAFLRHAICGKALDRIRQDAWESEYIHHCNQGPLFFRAWLLALLAIKKQWPRAADEIAGIAGNQYKQWPRAADEIPIVEHYLTEAIASYIQEDGGVDEGPSYAGAVCNTIALWALARDRHEPFRDYMHRVMPERFFRVSDYFRVMMSSDATPPLGAFLTVGDSGHGGNRHLAPDAALVMWLATGEPFWETVLRDMMIHSMAVRSENLFWLGLPVLMTLGPEGPEPARGTTLPVFQRLDVIGQLVSCRPSPLGLVRFQLVGAKKQASHSHEDIGSFIIEAAGEELAIDRGILTYSDTRCNRQVIAPAHNLLLPELPDGVEPRQLNPVPAAVIPEGRGDEKMLEARIDATAAWGKLFRRHIRSVASNEPTLFVITDEAEFDAPRAVSFNVHTRAPIVAAADGWRIVGARATLLITPRWTPARAEIAEDGVDGAGKPVNRLRLTATAAAAHRLVTELRVLPPATGNRG